MRWMFPLGFLWLGGCLHLPGRVLTICPSAATTGANCSFESREECYRTYEWMDEHGLEWSVHSGDTSIGRSPEDISHINSSQTETYEQFLLLRGVNDPRLMGHWTDIVSPQFIISNQGCLYFLYHNGVYDNEDLSSPVTSFKVLLRPLLGESMPHNRDILLRDYPGIMNDKWIYERLPINGHNGTFRVVFSGKQHRYSGQLIAIDRVRFTDGSCSSQDDDNYEPGDCDFEDGDLCGYHSESDNEYDIKWNPVRRDMLRSVRYGFYETYAYSASNIGRGAPTGNFLLVWGQDNRTGIMQTVSFKSPKITISEEGCLSVVYYNGRLPRENDDVDALVLHIEDNKSSQIYAFPTSLGQQWLRALIPLTEGQYSLNFNSTISLPFGDEYCDIIGLDDIEVHRKSCDKVRCDDEICAVNEMVCGEHGECVGRGTKHFTCACTFPYMGRACDYNADPATWGNHIVLERVPTYAYPGW